MQRLRGLVLSRVRLQPSLVRYHAAAGCSAAPASDASVSLAAAAAGNTRSHRPRWPQLSARAFAGAGFLDKAQVTERVLNIVKNFQKVEPAKASETRSEASASVATPPPRPPPPCSREHRAAGRR